MKSEKKTNEIARIENKFIFHAQYKFTSREQKVILYLIANINPKHERFIEQIIPVRDLEQVLKSDGKKWGGLYEEMRNFAKRIRSKGVEFDTNILIDGRRFPAYVNWFQSVVPVEREDGEICIRFLFSQDLEPFLLSLSQYAKINRLEIAPMRSGYSIRMFQIFRAHRDKMSQHETVSRLRYEVERLKTLLGIADSYHEFRDFNKRVLSVVQKEINENSSIRIIDIEKERQSRSISHITFIFEDQETQHLHEAVLTASNNPNTEEKEQNLKNPKMTYGDYLPSAEEITSLSKAKLDAYNYLIDFGVKEGIAFRQIIEKLRSSEVNGFEDWHIQEAIKIFKSKTNLTGKNAQAGAFVKWYTDQKVFESGAFFSEIMERLAKRKKRMSAEQRQNRRVAMDITSEAFYAYIARERAVQKPPAVEKNVLENLLDRSTMNATARNAFDFELFKRVFPTDFERIKTAVEQEIQQFLSGMQRPNNYNEILLNAIKTRCEQWYKQQKGK